MDTYNRCLTNVNSGDMIQVMVKSRLRPRPGYRNRAKTNNKNLVAVRLNDEYKDGLDKLVTKLNDPDIEDVSAVIRYAIKQLLIREGILKPKS